MFAVIRYRDLVRPGEGTWAEFDGVHAVVHHTKAGAESAMRGMVPAECANPLAYAGLRVEQVRPHWSHVVRD